MAESYKRSAEEIRGILEANGSLDSLREEVKLRKTIEFFLENSTVVERLKLQLKKLLQKLTKNKTSCYQLVS